MGKHFATSLLQLQLEWLAGLYGGCHFVLAQVKDKGNGKTRGRKNIKVKIYKKKPYKIRDREVRLSAGKPTASPQLFAFCFLHFAFCKIRQN